MSLQRHPNRQEPAPEVAPHRSRKPRLSPFTFWERTYAADLEKGGSAPDFVRGRAAGLWWGTGRRDEAAAYQLWLWEHRPLPGSDRRE